MRIALVSPYRLTVPGGVQQQVLGLADALVGLGDDVVVLAPGGPGDRSGGGWRLVPAGGTVTFPANGSRAPVAPTPQAMWRTRRALRAFGPDVVHVHEPFVPGPPLAAAFHRGAPMIATFHRSGAGRGYRALGHLLGPVWRHVDRAVAVSPAAAETVAAVVHRPVDPLVLGNAVDPERFDRAKRQKRARRCPVISFVGRHEARKGLATLLAAVCLLDRGVELRIVGDGPERESLQSTFRHVPAFTWLGAVDDAMLATELVDADLFVAPSLGGESFGIVLLEAMAAGTPVIASDLPAYRLVAGDAAVLVPPGDVRALARAIGTLLDDPAKRLALAEAGQARAATSTFAWLAGTYRTHYEELIALRAGATGATNQ
jgi:phosphatidylinositol alpha-mannosyltransferase